MPDTKLHEIKNVEIMRTGKWNATTFSVADLDAMCEAFPQVGFGVPITLGHTTDPGGEAFGWVSRLYRRGEVLLADFKDVPGELYEKIKRRAFDHCSIECWFNFERAGKMFKRVLKAVALLGAQSPAVSGLAPLRSVVNTANGTGTLFAFTSTFKMEGSMTNSFNERNLPPDQIADLRAKALIDAGVYKPEQYAEAVTRIFAEDTALAMAYASFTSFRE